MSSGVRGAEREAYGGGDAEVCTVAVGEEAGSDGRLNCRFSGSALAAFIGESATCDGDGGGEAGNSASWLRTKVLGRNEADKSHNNDRSLHDV
jgi:hypothetical protein